MTFDVRVKNEEQRAKTTIGLMNNFITPNNIHLDVNEILGPQNQNSFKLNSRYSSLIKDQSLT